MKKNDLERFEDFVGRIWSRRRLCHIRDALKARCMREGCSDEIIAAFKILWKRVREVRKLQRLKVAC